MKLKMAVSIVGRKEERDLSRIYTDRKDGTFSFPRIVDALEIKVQNPSEYALVQEGDQASSALSMRQSHNGMNQKETVIRVLKEGLTMPRASRFVRHLINVNSAKEGKGFLYDANGNLIEGDKLENYWQTMFHNHWIWSPESFKKSEKGKEGFLDLDIVTITGLDEKGKPIYQVEPLKRCLEQDCYADLGSMNPQGFLTRRSTTQKYVPGKTIYFFPPREGLAVRFLAGSDYADFVGYGDPLDAIGRLGVFACAEGDAKK